MSSHKSDGGRIPRLKNVASQSRSVSSPAMASARHHDAPAQLLPRPQIPRPTLASTRAIRASSVSSAEESRHSVARSDPSTIPAGQHARPSIPPRTATHPLPPTPLHPMPDGGVRQPFHMAAEPLNALDSDQRSPAPGRPRNVLRRKAPTIGQHTAQNRPTLERLRPEKLNVIIPDIPTIGPTLSASLPPSTNRSILASPMASEDNLSTIVPEAHVQTGPKELASLRTTINTQNLPPPTPIIPSASSPSTRYSESPGVWSRTSTPTTLSSYSPGIVHSAKSSRLRQPSPSQSRLPVFFHQTQQTSPASDRGQPGATQSPLLDQSIRAKASVTEAETKQSSAQTGTTNTTNASYSHLPRKTSASSTRRLSTKEKQNSEAEQKVEEKRVSRVMSHADKVRANLLEKPLQIPKRPTRDGTHQLILEPSPVVQSNISPKTVTGHKRRDSIESSPVLERRPGLNRSAATSIDSLHARAPSQTRVPASPELPRKSPRQPAKEEKLQHDTVAPGKSRGLGLFTKRSKHDMDARSESRSARKGPIAGTGHEGYGRYAQRGRRSSVSSSTSRARSTSTTRSGPKSVASSKGSTRSRPELDLDDFLLDRLEPVIIRGGNVDGIASQRRPSEQSTSGFSTASTSNLTQPSIISESPGCSTETLASSRASADSVEPAIKGMKHQISFEEQRVAYSRPETGPKVTKAPAASSIQDLHQSNLEVRPMRPRVPVETQSPPKQTKRGLGLKWNFFQRKQEPEKPEGKIKSRTAPHLHATVAPAPVHRPIAHYALIDMDSDPLEEIVHNVENSPPTEDDELSSPVEVPAALNIKKMPESILLPSPPKLHDAIFRDQPQSPKVYFNKSLVSQSPEVKQEGERQSRLTSVGRIPRVVSRRERPHKPAVQSFSRPFSVAQSPPSMTAPVAETSGGISFSPIFTQGPLYPTLPGKSDYKFDLTNPFKDPLKGSVLDFIAGPYSKEEFMRFSPRKDSVLSTSSGSDSLAAVTAVMPGPDSELTEDEIWGEYDDLIDHVLSPQTTSTLFESESEVDHKLELATMASKTLQAEINGGPGMSAPSEQPAVELTASSPRSSTGSVRLRRSRIVAELHSSLVPSSQPSYSEIIASYCDDRSESSIVEKEVEDKLLAPNPIVEQQSGLLSSPALATSPSFEICRQRNTVLFDIAERDREGPTAYTNIRSGSLMTSRWLSFGRVLFSPAHNHAKGSDQERILVVDGLGNDDWSFYCALTYPNAEVYSLTDGPKPIASKHPQAWQPPSNHHTIQHTSSNDQLPFPRGFFAVAVLRFPAACSEKAQDNIISECKRVLRAGGYLEMSILDLDMVNMGIRTRKAVRTLKERTYISDANISLKPASDSIQRLLERHKFDNLRRCMVRIPVAGMIVRSSASSTSTSSSNPSTILATTSPNTTVSPLTGLSTAAKAKARAHGKSSSNDTDLSLGDLLSDPSPSPSNDESIRKIVAKVGRWWYTRCYEIPVLPNGDVALSIWSDRKILRECQQRGTGFRLWIAYAQKPSEKRRTASV